MKNLRVSIGFVALFLLFFSISSNGQVTQNLLSSNYIASEISDENFVLSEPGKKG